MRTTNQAVQSMFRAVRGPIRSDLFHPDDPDVQITQIPVAHALVHRYMIVDYIQILMDPTQSVLQDLALII